jgi:predicted negative regulator of RcsB-dependent stress response
LLLGDIYFKEKDYFNAKATYQSVLDNAKSEDIRQQAQQKLNQLPAEERQSSKTGDN